MLLYFRAVPVAISNSGRRRPEAPFPGPSPGLARVPGRNGGKPPRRRAVNPGLTGSLPGCLPAVHSLGQAQNGLMRVVATRVEQDGTMQRRVVDTVRSSDGPRWEDLACRALAVPPPYRP